MKHITRLLIIFAIAIITAVSAHAETPSLTLVCNEDGYRFSGEIWTAVKIPDDVLGQYNYLEEDDLASAIERHVKNNNMTGQTQMINKDGIAEFNVEEGTYLLYRTAVLSGEYASSPIIVSFPEIINGQPYYDIQVKAKFAKVEQDTPTPVTPPKGPDTGDYTHFIYLFGIILLAVIGLISPEIVKHKKTIYN